MTFIVAGAALVVAALVAFVAVRRASRRLVEAARRVARFTPAPDPRGAVHASLPATLLATRFVSNSGGIPRRFDVSMPALPPTPGELQVQDAGLVFVAGTAGLVSHDLVTDLSWLAETAGTHAGPRTSLLAVTLDLQGDSAELVFALEGPRVEAERVRREAHVRGARVQQELAGTLRRLQAAGK